MHGRMLWAMKQTVDSSRAALYPDPYLWLVLTASVDVMLTWLALELGGVEANPAAEWVLRRGGFPAMVVYRLGIIAAVIGVCEFVGRRHPTRGRTLAYVAVAISAFPVFWTLPQLIVYAQG